MPKTLLNFSILNRFMCANNVKVCGKQHAFVARTPLVRKELRVLATGGQADMYIYIYIYILSCQLRRSAAIAVLKLWALPHEPTRRHCNHKQWQLKSQPS